MATRKNATLTVVDEKSIRTLRTIVKRRMAEHLRVDRWRRGTEGVPAAFAARYTAATEENERRAKMRADLQYQLRAQIKGAKVTRSETGAVLYFASKAAQFSADGSIDFPTYIEPVCSALKEIALPAGVKKKIAALGTAHRLVAVDLEVPNYQAECQVLLRQLDDLELTHVAGQDVKPALQKIAAAIINS